MGSLRFSPLLCCFSSWRPALESPEPRAAARRPTRLPEPRTRYPPPSPWRNEQWRPGVTVQTRRARSSDLTNNFELEEDGKPQPIRYFSAETNLPLTVGLLVDTSMSERDNIDRERTASRSFLDQMITRPVDRAFVIHFDREIELLQDLTSDHAKLEKAVGEIDVQPAVESTPTSDQDRTAPDPGAGPGRNSTTRFSLPAMKLPKNRPAARPSSS